MPGKEKMDQDSTHSRWEMFKNEWVQMHYKSLSLHLTSTCLPSPLVHTLTGLKFVKVARVMVSTPCRPWYGNEPKIKHEVLSGALISPGLHT